MPRKPRPAKERPTNRVIAYFFDDEMTELRDLAADERQSISELIRQAFRLLASAKRSARDRQ